MKKKKILMKMIDNNKVSNLKVESNKVYSNKKKIVRKSKNIEIYFFLI